MPALDSYLFFADGRCAEAMHFYQRTLGGKLEPIMTYAQSPEPNDCTESAGNQVMHACLNLDGRLLMASDVPPGMGGTQPMGGFSLSLNYPSADEARRIFDRLADGGKVTMPMARTFWSEAFGMLTDRFGVPWMVGGGQRTA